MALKYAGGSETGATGSTTSSNQNLKWTLTSAMTDVPGLTNYSKITSTAYNGNVADYQGNVMDSSGEGEPIMLYTQNGTWKGLEQGNELIGYALGDINGKQNTGVISELGSLSNYPAFASVLNYYTPGTQAGDWYLPASGELAIVCANQSRINPVLSNISASYSSYCMPDIDNNYWSSTEYDSGAAFQISVRNSSAYSSEKNMGNIAPVIPMLQK